MSNESTQRTGVVFPKRGTEQKYLLHINLWGQLMRLEEQQRTSDVPAVQIL